jgi:hypothetical protein
MANIGNEMIERILRHNVARARCNSLFSYINQLAFSKVLLWCYVIWYGVMVKLYFVADSALWLNSAGLAFIVGNGLVLSTGGNLIARFKSKFWETLRLFLCPFLVSTFTALTNQQNFTLIFSPKWSENLSAVGLILLFLLLTALVKQRAVKLT